MMPMICSDCGSFKWMEDATGVDTSFEFRKDGKVHTIDTDVYGEVSLIRCYECKSTQLWEFEEGYFTPEELKELFTRQNLDRFGYLLQLAWKYRQERTWKGTYNPVFILRKEEEIIKEAQDLHVPLDSEVDLEKVS